MEFSIQLHTIKAGWSIVYIEGSQVINLKKKNIISFSEDRFSQVGKVSTNFAAAKNGKVGSNFSAAKNGQVSSNSKKR